MALTQVKTNAIADDAVTTDKLADAINTERTANTAKVSLEDNSVTLAKMAGGTDGQIITYDANGDPVAVGPGTDGQVLTSTGAGSPPAFETPAAGGISDVVSDTSPQLGGNLDVNSKNIEFGDSSGASDDRLTFGAGTDLKIYHDGTNSYVENDNSSGALILTSAQDVEISAADDWTIHGVANGQVELYYDGAKQCETSANGLAFPSGKGIDFSAHGNAAGASSEVLDDYETGTWTIGGDDANFNGFGSVDCHYSKVGRLVTISGTMVCLTNSSSTSFYVKFIPFAPDTKINIPVASPVSAADDGLFFFIDAGGTTGYLRNASYGIQNYGTFSNQTLYFTCSYVSNA